MKLFVTGGCGYFGAYLIPHLLAAGHEITCFDSQLFGHGHLSTDNGMLTIVKADLDDQAAVAEHITGAQAVIHLAGITSDRACQLHPDLARKVNVDLFQPLLRAAQDAGVSRFIFPSSVAAYGSGVDLKEHAPLMPTTAYGRAKAECEDILRKSNLDWTILRPGTITGHSPRMRFDLTINMMTLCAIQTGKINVAGGDQMRSFVSMRDMVELMKMLITKKSSRQTFNVASWNASVRAAAELVRACIDTPVKIEIGPRTDDRSYSVNCDRLSTCGFKPLHSLRDAIGDMQARADYWPDGLTSPVYMNQL